MTVAIFVGGLIIYNNEKCALSTLKSEKTLLICTLSDYPEEKENSFRMILKLNEKIESGKIEALKGSLLIYNKKDSSAMSLIPGDILILRCTPVEISNRANPFEFNYRFFMENQGIRYSAFTTSKDFISHIIPIHRKLIHRALITREKIISMFRECGITGERLALVAAITLGQKSMLDPEQKLNFMKAGVMHIMAVSGLHAIILSLFVFNLLFFMKGRFNILRVIITIVILWSFAFVTGLTPSVLRATLMYSFLQAGKLMQRPANSINLVLASAFVLIISRPSVIFDAGFLLSYSAVIYIISFYQGFYMMVQFKNWLADKLWQSVVVTLVAQAGTLPLTIMLFNRFPTYFILANITIVPVSNLLIITGCLIPMVYPIRILSHFLAILLNYLTGLTEYLTSLLFVFSGIVKDIFNFRTNELIVYNTPGSSTIGFRTGKTLNLFTDTLYVSPEIRRHGAALGLKIQPQLLKNNYCCIKAGREKVLITNYLNNKIIKNYEPDLVILTGSHPEIESDLVMAHGPKQIIISSAASSGYRFPRQINISGIDSVHLVRKSGAFIKMI